MQKYVTIQNLKDLYDNNQDIFHKDASLIKSHSFTNISQFFKMNISITDHFVWRINRMNPARLLRQLFRKPEIVTNWTGQSIERYIIIDGPKSEPYTYPNLECSYVFVMQTSGIRTVILKPSRECSEHCKTVSVVLKPSYVCKYFAILK